MNEIMTLWLTCFLCLSTMQGGVAAWVSLHRHSSTATDCNTVNNPLPSTSTSISNTAAGGVSRRYLMIESPVTMARKIMTGTMFFTFLTSSSKLTFDASHAIADDQEHTKQDQSASDKKREEKERKEKEKEAKRIAEETKKRLAVGRIGQIGAL